MVWLSRSQKLRKYNISIPFTGDTRLELTPLLKECKIQHYYNSILRISYCADDKAEKRFFSFIAKEADSEKHTCFVFVSDKLVRFLSAIERDNDWAFQAEEITLTIGQAFDLAYKRFLSGKTQESDKEKIARLERENAELTQRLKDVGNLLEPAKLADYMKRNNVSLGPSRLYSAHFELFPDKGAFTGG